MTESSISDEELAQIEERQRAAGIVVEEPAYEDYFGTDRVERYMLPDGKQWIDLKILDFGDQSEYQEATTRDITLKRNTGDANIKLNPAEERRVLIILSVVNWNMVRRDPSTGKFVPVTFSKSTTIKNGRITAGGGTFDQWLAHAPAKIVNDLENKIREINPWLRTDNETVEALQEEIDRLTERRDILVRAQAGK
jgi:hypothetical protein